MFERFTDRARKVIVLAQANSRLLFHHYIGTEHILLGLLEEGEGVACRALRELGVDFAGARADVEELIGTGNSDVTGHIPFTPRAKKVLELSLREAIQLGHNYIGTEHILLGLIREGEGVASQVLQKRGVELSRVRAKVMEILGGFESGRSHIRIRRGGLFRRASLEQIVKSVWSTGSLRSTLRTLGNLSDQSILLIQLGQANANKRMSDEITPEDLMLAIFQLPETSIFKVLRSVGLDQEKLEELLEELESADEEEGPERETGEGETN